MHIISTTSQKVTFISRNVSGNYNVVITDEQSKEVIDKQVSSIEVGNYQETDLSFTPTIGRYYTIELYDNGQLEYRGKMFCTDQTDYPKYTTIKDEYKAEQSDNEYIIYE